jgi:thiol-disulfide isomerase/thioredoxin
VNLRSWLAVCLLAAAAACSPPVEQTPLSDPPAFSAIDAAGTPVDLASLRGSVVLLNAWATWCKPCRQEIPYLSELQSREGARGLRVVGVSVDTAADREAVLASAPRLGIRYTLWLDPHARVAALMQTTAVPASVLIGRNGAVRWRHMGVLREDTPGFAQALARALEER